MLLRRAWLSLSVLVCVMSMGGTAYAGPVELLNGVSISGSTPKNMVVPFDFGGEGMFVSQDGGAKLSWLCAAGIAPSANNSIGPTFMSGDDHIYVGMFNGLYRGGADGCGWERVPELEKLFVRTITSDPIDPKRTYVGTSSPMMDNYIYMSDGSSPFAPLGAATPLWIDTLHVVKNGDARRFYETVVLSNVMTNEVTYSVRVSDDDGKTWSEDKFDLLDPMDKSNPVFKLVAVDPENPDRVLGRVSRGAGKDALVLSTQKGKTGSWKMIAEPVELGGAAFTPDGKLFYGESDSMQRGLYVIESEGAEPKRINSDVRVFCVNYDEANQRLLGCANNYWFGTFDMASGALTPMLDMRCTEHAVKCADKPEIQELCQPPGVEFCKLDHWVIAPICSMYDRGPEFCQFVNSQDFACDGGMIVPKEEGAPIAQCAGPTSPAAAGGCAGACGQAAAGEGGAPAASSGSGPAAAGSNAAAGSGGTPGVDPGKSGCGCSVPGGASMRARVGGAALGLLAIARLMGRRRWRVWRG